MQQNYQDPSVSTNNRHDDQPQTGNQPHRFTPHLIENLLNQPSTNPAQVHRGQQSSQIEGQLFYPEESVQRSQYKH